MSVSKVYFPEHGEILVHQSGVLRYPQGFPSGYFWYGKKRHSPGRLPKWVETPFRREEVDSTETSADTTDSEAAIEEKLQNPQTDIDSDKETTWKPVQNPRGTRLSYHRRAISFNFKILS